MKKLLFICFIINLGFIFLTFGQIVYLFIDYDGFVDLFINPDNRVLVTSFYYIFFIPTMILWIYNIRFLWKRDRYSKAIIPLIIFHFLYSPYYYYTRILKRSKPLANEIAKEPVLGRTVHLEEYETEKDWESDLNK